MTPALLVGAGLLLSLWLVCGNAGAIDRFVSTRPVATSPLSSEDLANDTPAAGIPEPVQSETNVPSAIPAPDPSAVNHAPTNALRVPDPAGELNRARQFALGMLETGNKDSAIGGLGEVSRFQIMPSVWKQYTSSQAYRDLNTSTEVARRHWASLYDYFKRKAQREPTDFDMYVLWNTRFGYYANRGFAPDRVHPVIRDRAQRFVNLVEDESRRESSLEVATTR